MKSFRQFLYESVDEKAQAVAVSRRQGIEHFHAMKPAAFLDWIETVKKDAKGILKDIRTVLKVDGLGCLHESTIVDTLEHGKITIKSLVENFVGCHIKSWDQMTNKVVYERVLDSRVLEEGGDWYEVESECGKILTITGNHPVFLEDLKCWRRVDELEPGDNILVNSE